MPRQSCFLSLPGLYFVKIFGQKSPSRKIGPCELTKVKYRPRYSFSTIFRPQKSQIKTQNSQLKIPKVPPLEKIRLVFHQILPSAETPEKTVFFRFNVC